MPKIKSITCHKVLDSRAEWTIETHVKLDDGSEGVQTIPEGASKGEREAVSLPATKAVELVSGVINDALEGEDPFNQSKLDNALIEMDGTKNKHHFGANSLLSVSLACAKAAADSKKLELWEYLSVVYSGTRMTRKDLHYPTPVFNILNGGKHASNNLSFQEFMVIPSQKLSVEKSLELGVNIYHQLKKDLMAEGFEVDVGDEGGFAPNGFTVTKALSFIKRAATKICKVGEDVFFGMDVAAESFYKLGEYLIKEENLELKTDTFIEYYEKLVKNYELIYIEDPFYERDNKSWKIFNEKFGKKLMVVADDLVVTNTEILKEAIREDLANAVIVKPNQIGTLTETFEFIKTAKKANMSTIVSHRSGDTAEDTFIADLSVAVRSDFMKSGAPVRGERVAKYNRLLEILSNN